MPFTDLSTVTDILTTLIDLGIQETGALGSTIEVVNLPPDRISASVDTVSVFLFHVAPDSSQRAFSDSHPGKEDLALTLRYQITAHNKLTDSRENRRIQNILGLAMRVLHTYSSVNSQTEVFGRNLWSEATVLDDIDELNVTLIPVSYEQSMTHWNAMDSALRPAVYYEVGVVYLEPSDRRQTGEPVLTPSSSTGLGLVPTITSTSSTMAFETESGLSRPFVSRPARISTLDAFSIYGINLQDASGVQLIDEAATHEGVVTYRSGVRLNVSVPEFSTAGAITPGLKRVVVVSERGPSNIDTLWITPKFSVTKTAPREFTIVSPFQPEWEVRLSVGGDILEETTSAPAAGEFRRFDDRLEWVSPVSTPEGRTITRLTINDSSGAPSWVDIG